MWRALFGLLDPPARAVSRRLTIRALLLVAAAVLVWIALFALSAAAYLALAPIVGAIGAALAVAASAFVLAAIALLPVLIRRHPPPPPAKSDPIDVATILPILQKGVQTRPLLISAIVLALVAALTSKPPKKDQ
jgi:hypothetical protein